VITGSPWFLDDPNPKNRKFVSAFKKKYNADPDQFAAQAYDALSIMAAALKKVKLTDDVEKDRTVLRDELAKVKNFQTVGGRFSFDANRDAEQKGRVLIMEHGRFTVFAE
jgi:branched-chain amino acid transport system substrate-binding protein